MNQATALSILKSGQNVFLTGAAGTGKTYVLNQYIRYLREHQVPLAVTASTGIAATHLNGQTIHSWSGLGIKDVVTDDDLNKLLKKTPIRKKIEKAQVLIIDEISMLSKQNLENINEILKFVRASFSPFGGMQVIFCGDFFQLPPVSRERIPNHEKFAFMAPIWRDLNLKVCYLTQQYRQSDNGLTNLLNEIRSGDITDSTVDLLQENMERAQEVREVSLRLFTHNADVESINQQELEHLASETKDYIAQTKGSQHLLDSLRKSLLVSDTILLKEGAQVMFVKNNFEAGYMNGTMGTITGFTSEEWPVVTTFDHVEIIAQPVEWSVNDEFGNPVAVFSQVPLRLAWAITVHKSQGMTLDTAVIDLSKTFEPGQGYVALSRVKTWSGLYLMGCNQNALLLDELAMKADKRFQELSDESEAYISQKSDQELEHMATQFVLRCGGSVTPVQYAPQFELEKKPKESTYEKTYKLLESGKSLESIMEIRGLTFGTIVSHLQKLKSQDPELDLSICRPEEVVLQEIGEVLSQLQSGGDEGSFDDQGRIRSKRIFESLDGKYSYEAIRLARLFLD